MRLHLWDVVAASVFDKSKQEADPKGEWRYNFPAYLQLILKQIFKVVLVISYEIIFKKLGIQMHASYIFLFFKLV